LQALTFTKKRFAMKKFLKLSAIIVVSLVVIIIAALLIIPRFVNLQKYKPQLEAMVAEKTGRTFSVGDNLQLSLFPWAGVSVSDLKLGNPSGFEEKEFVTVKAFEIRVKFLPLLFSLFKDIEIQRFILNEPRIVMVQNKDGRVNWTLPEKSAPTKKEPPKAETKAATGSSSGAGLPIRVLTVGDFSVKNGALIYIDHQADSRTEITDMNATMRDVSLNRPIQVSFSARIDNQPISLEGSLGPVGTEFGREPIPLDFNLKALNQVKMGLKGKLENPTASPSVKLAVEVAEFSPRQLFAALNRPFPVQTTDPKALDRVAFSANIDAGAKNVSISDGKLDLDESKMNFTFKASDFTRPNVAFDVALDQIDADRYLPPSTEKKPAEQTGSEKTAVNYAPLRRLILDGRLKIGKATIDKAKLENINLQVQAKDGIIKLDPLTFNLYQGDAAVKSILNVAKDVPVSDINLVVNKVQAGPLLRDVMDKDILEGVARADVTLSMTGDDAAAIKKTLNGKGELVFKDGAIKGIDLAGMVRNAKAAFGLAEKLKEKPQTDFAELAVPFSITDGVFNTPQTSLQAPLLRVLAAGKADLVKDTLDFRVEPKLVGTLKGQGDEKQRAGLLVPVLVTGSFSDPKFRPDLKAVAKQQLEQNILESDKIKKALENEKLKPLQDLTKDLKKGILGQ
jgi:AsmA protein